MAQSPAPAAKFLTQPLVSGIYTADPSAHVFNGKIYIYPLARHRRRHSRRRPRQPLRHARLPRVLDGRHRRDGHGSRRRARHQGRAVGRPADVGAGRRREGRQVLPVLPGEGQAGRLPHRRGRRRQARRARSRPQPEADQGSFSIDPAVFKDDDGKYYMYFGGLWGGQLQRWADGRVQSRRRRAAGR